MGSFRTALLEAEETDSAIRDRTFEREVICALDLRGLDFECVQFLHCRLLDCPAERAGFYGCTFRGCDLSNQQMPDSYWKDCRLQDCKCDGWDLSLAAVRQTQIISCSLDYSNFFEALFDDVCITDSRLRDASLQHVRLKKTTLQRTDLTRAELFRTSLCGMDLSSCEIGGIILSETLSELKGAKLSAYQAVQIAGKLGITIV